MDDDDGATAGGGQDGGSSFTSAGPLRGGRGSPTGTREKSGFERGASQVGAGLVGALSGVPGASTALRSIAAGSDTFNVGLATGQRIATPGAGNSGDDNSRFFATAGQPAGSSGQLTGGQNVASAAEIAINRALGFQEEAAAGATTSLEEGRDQSLAALLGGAERGTEALDPFNQAGLSALEQEQAFLGLSGKRAERDALAGFTQSPGARFAQQEEEQALFP